MALPGVHHKAAPLATRRQHLPAVSDTQKLAGAASCRTASWCKLVSSFCCTETAAEGGLSRGSRPWLILAVPDGLDRGGGEGEIISHQVHVASLPTEVHLHQ